MGLGRVEPMELEIGRTYIELPKMTCVWIITHTGTNVCSLDHNSSQKISIKTIFETHLIFCLILSQHWFQLFYIWRNSKNWPQIRIQHSWFDYFNVRNNIFSSPNYETGTGGTGGTALTDNQNRPPPKFLWFLKPCINSLPITHISIHNIFSL